MYIYIYTHVNTCFGFKVKAKISTSLCHIPVDRTGWFHSAELPGRVYRAAHPASRAEVHA